MVRLHDSKAHGNQFPLNTGSDGLAHEFGGRPISYKEVEEGISTTKGQTFGDSTT